MSVAVQSRTARSFTTKPLGEIFDVVGGGTPPKNNASYFSGNIPWATIRDMHSDVLAETEHTISHEGLRNSSAKLIPAGEVIMASRVGLGKACILQRDTAINQDIRALLPLKPNTVDRRFCLYWLQSVKKDIIAAGTGATVQGIKLPFIKSLPFPNAPFEDQKRIVEVLDQAFADLDRARTLAEANLADAEEMFRLPREAMLDGDGRGWPSTTIGEVCDRFEYGTSAKSQPKGAVPVLRMGNLQAGRLDWSDLVFTDNRDDIRKLSLQAGDVLFNRTNSVEHVGKTAIYRGEQPAIFAGYLIRLHRKEALIDAEFLNLYLNSDRARDYGRSVMGKSVNQANISASKLASYPIQLPTLEEQTEIAETLNMLSDQVDGLRASYKTKLHDISDLRQSLLQKAFAGDLT